MKNKIGLIGAGIIGSELSKRLVSRGHDVEFIIRNSGIYDSKGNRRDAKENYDNYLEKVDAVCLSIPTVDYGGIAFKYIKSCLDHKKPVVTCEKGALSGYFSELENSLNLIGYNATVGGGTRLLSYGRERMNKDVLEIHAVLNGTLNYIFSESLQQGSMGGAINMAKKLGYAEPGASTHLDVINLESFRDIPMKTAILFNILGLGKIKAIDLDSKMINSKQLKELAQQLESRRYIVSITREKNSDNDIIGGFNFENNGWFISAGFKDIHKNTLYSRLKIGGANNALLMYEGKDGENGIYSVSGPGAGAEPTTASMILDLEKLLGGNKK